MLLYKKIEIHLLDPKLQDIRPTIYKDQALSILARIIEACQNLFAHKAFLVLQLCESHFLQSV
jgi:hypothetical protein